MATVALAPATGDCSYPTLVGGAAGTHDFIMTATAMAPTSQVFALTLPSVDDIFEFRTAPTPATGTPGGPHTDTIASTLTF